MDGHLSEPKAALSLRTFGLKALENGNDFRGPELVVAPALETFFLLVKLSPELIADGCSDHSFAGNQIFDARAAHQAGGTKQGANFKFSKRQDPALVFTDQPHTSLKQQKHASWNDPGIDHLLAHLKGDQFNGFQQFGLRRGAQAAHKILPLQQINGCLSHGWAVPLSLRSNSPNLRDVSCCNHSRNSSMLI